MSEQSSTEFDFSFECNFEKWAAIKNQSLNKENLEDKITIILEFWNSYPCTNRVGKQPRNVWKILPKIKISKLERLYGIYYTLSLVLDNNISLSEYQLDNGDVKDVILIDNLMIMDNKIYNKNSISATYLYELDEAM